MAKIVSVIVPVYNSDKVVQRAIKSVINQSYKDFELILVDDGSTDKSLEILREYEKKDKRIKVFTKKNSGVSSTRNFAIERARGSYIIFLDSDDFLEKESLNLLMKAQDEKSYDLIVYKIVKNENRDNKNLIYSNINKKSQEEIVSELIYNGDINPAWNKIYKRDIIEENKIRFDEKISYGEDMIFSIAYIEKINNILVLENEFYNYDISTTNSLTDIGYTKLYENTKRMNDYLHKAIEKKDNLFKKSQASYNYKTFIDIIASLISLRANKIEKNKKNEIINKILKDYYKFDKKDMRGISYKILTKLYNIRSKKVLFLLSDILYFCKKIRNL